MNEEQVPKISVEIDGKIYNADNVESFLLMYENGLWRIQITTGNVDSEENFPIHPPIEEIPEVTQPILGNGQFHPMQEEDLQKLRVHSALRKTKKARNKNGEEKIVVCESSVYDIVNDVNGFSQAIEEVAEKETELAKQGWVFDEDVEKPTYVFASKDSQEFKVITKINIIKY